MFTFPPRPEPHQNPPWLGLAAGARSTNHQTANWPSLIKEGWPGRFIGTPQNPENNLANRENHLAAEGGDPVCRGGGGVKRTS